MAKENNKILTGFTIIFFVFVFVLSINAQSTSKAADDLVIKLQQKVLLNQKQADQIKNSLNEYLENPSDENRISLESNIESLLEDKQKMKYNIIKKDWWESVSKQVTKVKTD